MTVPPILEHLSREFETAPESVQRALEMLDAGLTAPFIGRFRRGETGGIGEYALRRMQRRRAELEELDRRRGTILRMLEKEAVAGAETLEAIRACMDRFEIEDLFVPHRRPEPEVQLAIDRGLLPLAELLVAPVPRSERGEDAHAPEEGGEGESGATDEAHSDPDLPAHGEPSHAGAAQAEAAHADSPSSEPGSAGTAHAEAAQADAAHGESAHGESAHGESAHGESAHADPEQADAAHAEHAASVATQEAPPEGAPAPESAEEHEEEAPRPAPTLEPVPVSHAHIDVKAAMNAQLARLCADFVRPDKGIHTETEALHGALRILSDRLGRNARLRGVVRNLLRKHGVLSVRPAGDESRLGRHKALLKVKQPLRQLQGHRLLGIRQAQKERAVNAVLTLDPKVALPKVRAALGRHLQPAWSELLDEVCLQALQHRLLPIVEQDVRLELKERADLEALRFLTQHLRQILLAPVLPNVPVLGLDVSAKGDWTVVPLGENGAPLAPDARIEVGEKAPEALGAELAAVLAPHAIRHVAIGNGKLPRAAAARVRAALRAVSAQAWVLEVNDAGLSTYASSELARKELPDAAVPARMAISLGRRLQDPLHELLKVDPRHLGLGWEQGLVSKANVRRALTETVESCTALAGGDVNTVPLALLAQLPGLDRAAAERIVARRAEKPFTNREELRQEGLLTEAQWASVAAFLRVHGGSEPLDATNLHPEQYPLARRLLEAAGTTVEQALGRPGATRGLRRADFEVDEGTWRDVMRELAFPGRDPRYRQWGPTLLDPDTDPVRLVRDRVVEGVVTNVASFGAFVDIGLASDALVHVSEVWDRYVRDAREVLTIGQVVRARILDASGSRLALSLKIVPGPEQAERPERRPRREGDARGPGGGEGRGAGGGGPGRGRRDRRRGRPDRGSEPEPSGNVRAAVTRRDGIGARTSGGRGRGGPGGGPGGGRGGGRRDDDRRRGGAGDVADREDLARLSALRPENKPAHNPFAAFFKGRKEDPG